MSRMVLRVLTDSEIEVIHDKSLQLVETVGFKISHEEALAKFEAAGAAVDHSSGIVRLPRKLAEEFLAAAPSSVLLGDIRGNRLRLGGDDRVYWSLILDPFIIDYEKGPRRPVLEDVRRHTILGESLSRVGAMQRMAFPVEDVKGPDSYYKTMEMFLCHMSKHVFAMPTSPEDAQDWIDVMEAVAGAASRPSDAPALLTLGMAVTSPLQIHGPNVEITKKALEHGLFVLPTVCPMAGTTSPYTIASTLIQSNVESLMLVFLAQLYKPGHPVLYAVGPSVTDMKTGSDMYYRVEKMLFKTMGCQMAKFYDLPSSTEVSGTLTYRPDVQNGAESMLYSLSAVLCGQNLMGGIGTMHNANGMSAEQIIMQCGLLDMAEYLHKGVDLSEEALGMEAFKRVGPGGNFMTDPLTLDRLRGTEFFDSPHLDLTGGYQQGAPGMLEKAHQTVERIIAEYRPTVPEAVQSAVRAFCAKRYSDPRTVGVGWD